MAGTRQEVSAAIIAAFEQLKLVSPGVVLVLEDNGPSFRWPFEGKAGDFVQVADVVALAQAGGQPDNDFAEEVREQLDAAGVDYDTWC